MVKRKTANRKSWNSDAVVGQKEPFTLEQSEQIEVNLLQTENWHDLALQSVGLDSSSVQDFSEESANEFLIRTESPDVTVEGFATHLKEALDI